MKRILALWLPNWPIQRRRVQRPELAGRPILLQAPSRRGQAVAACSAEAHTAGVRCGMTVTEALSLLNQTAHIELHQPQADRCELERLARWCCQFSPTVGLEDADAPETLLLDVTNLAPLYGGEAALIEQVKRACQRRGLEVRLALADTIGAAWALAHYQAEKLASLPLAALRLPADLRATLADLGLKRIGELVELPREQLRSRLGSLVLLRIDQALGRAGEVFFPIDPPPDFAVEHAYEYPIAGAAAIRYTVEQLLKRLVLLLAARGAGVLRLRCRLVCEGAPPVAFEFDLFQPTARWRHLLEILDMHLERLRLPAPALAVALRVVRHAPLAERQSQLFDQQRELGDSRALAALIDRLAGRLGSEAVVHCSLVPEVQPELAFRETALNGSAPGPLKQVLANKITVGEDPLQRSGRADEAARCLDRPLSLLAHPAPLAAWSVAPNGPPTYFHHSGQQHEVLRHWGPERIETGWWRRMSAWRDYYRVETTAGRRFWLFRRCRDGKWFLHGSYE